MESTECDHCLYDKFDANLRSKPMPFVGLYIAIASLVCCIAIIADIFHGVRHKKLWIPCRYFTLNAATLTLLSIAMKLPSDLTAQMTNTVDAIAKFDGVILMGTSIATFMPSLGSMSGKDILQNMIALTILVITVSVNIIIQIPYYHYYYNMRSEIVSFASISFLFGEFVLLILSAAMIGVIKTCLAKEYDERHTNLISNIEGLEIKEMLQVKRLRTYVKYYWVMAETGSPVFVMARSVTCSAGTFLCLVSVAVFYVAVALYYMNYLAPGDLIIFSEYKWSIYMIVAIQSLCIIVGTIPPALRTLLIAISFSQKSDINHLRFAFKIEEYWIASFKAWKQRPLSLHIQNHTLRKIIHYSKIIFLNLCIVVQITIVFWSKFIILLSYLFLKPIIFFFNASKNCVGIKSKDFDELLDLKGYVLLLEGELELPQRVLMGICSSLDQVIKTGAKQQSGRLLKFFVEKDSFNLNSLVEFDSDEVVSIHSEEPSRCWSLSIISLLCIAIALPTIDHNEKRNLVNTVGEGFSYVRHVEKCLDTKKILKNVGKAADVVWNGVELRNRWLGYNLQGKTVRGKNTKEVLSYLAEISECKVKVVKESKKSKFMENPLNWPEDIIAANSFYRVSKTILLQ